MRITYITPRYPPFLGGVEMHVERLAQAAAGAGHDVTVLTHRTDPELGGRELRDGIEILRFDSIVPKEDFTFAPSLWAHVRLHGERLGLVHAHAYHGLPALSGALFKRFPLIFTPHYHGTGHSLARRMLHPPYRRLGRLLFDRAETTICVSEAEARLVRSHFPSCAPRISVVHNGVDMDDIRAAEPFETDGPTILSAGRLESYKGVDGTIRAMAELPEEFRLVVTGAGPMRDELDALVRELGLGERVRLLGRVSDEELHRWFRTAVAYVSLSSNEAYPITPLEALLGGCRFIGSDIPAHHEVARATEGTTTIVPLRVEPQPLAAAIAEIVARPVDAPKILSWREVAEQTFEVYERAMAAAGAGAAVAA
jgi:glycosyltransferase involved in cell wall biosynthesis